MTLGGLGPGVTLDPSLFVFLLRDVENLRGITSFKILQRHCQLLKMFALLPIRLPFVCELKMAGFAGVCSEFDVQNPKRCEVHPEAESAFCSPPLAAASLISWEDSPKLVN